MLYLYCYMHSLPHWTNGDATMRVGSIVSNCTVDCWVPAAELEIEFLRIQQIDGFLLPGNSQGG